MSEMITQELTAIGVVEFIQELDALVQSGKNRVFPVKGVLTKKKIEDRVVVHLTVFPVSIGHGDLVQICKKKT